MVFVRTAESQAGSIHLTPPLTLNPKPFRPDSVSKAANDPELKLQRYHSGLNTN